MIKTLALVLVAFLATAATTTTTNFEISNNSSTAIGIVRISGSGQYTDVDVAQPKTSYVTQISYTATSVTINAQTFTYPNGGTVSLLNGKSVRLDWSTSSLVEIFDPMQLSRPQIN